MCQNRNSRWAKLGNGKRFRADGCIRDLIVALNDHGIETLGSCCGHGCYPMTIVYKSKDKILKGNLYDFCSGWGVPRSRNFYKKDLKGYFYIPEVSKMR